MDIEQIRKIVGKCRNYSVAEISYKRGVLITRTAFLDPFDNAISHDSFEDIPDEYRGNYRKTYPGLPCLSIALSLDRNHTAMDQPRLLLLPEDVESIDLLTEYTGQEKPEFTNAVQIRTRDEGKHFQTVVGYVNESDLQKVITQQEIPKIQIASFLEGKEPKEIVTVSPIIDIFALVRNK